MDLNPYMENLRRELSLVVAVAADTGGEDGRSVADRLTAPVESAIRLTLLDVLSDAADEITRELAPGSVEVRLRGGEPEFAVAAAPPDEPAAPAAAPAPPPEAEDGATARINLRLPEHLKTGIEQAAAAERLSVNAWLVRAVAASLGQDDRDREPRRRGGRIGQSYTGWVR